MPAGPIGDCWIVGSWEDTAWEENSWEDTGASVEEPMEYVTVPAQDRWFVVEGA
jgi:hypothetical protein